MRFKYNDGGRHIYFGGRAADCVVRAIAIALNKDYEETYNEIKKMLGHTARNGVSKTDTRKIMEHYGFKWKPCMTVGSGCTTHLKEDELPTGIIICKLSHHVCCVINGEINDTFDPTRNGNRCVYGYWYK